MKKSVIFYVLCSCLVMVRTWTTSCPNITAPAGCQECTTKHNKNTCEVSCKACRRADKNFGPTDTTIQFERDEIKDIEIIVDANGELSAKSHAK